MITLAAHIAHCQALIARCPAAANFPVIFAEDEEGNDYHKVYSYAALAEVLDLEKDSLDLGAITDLQHIPSPLPKCFNAVIIN